MLPEFEIWTFACNMGVWPWADTPFPSRCVTPVGRFKHEFEKQPLDGTRRWPQLLPCTLKGGEHMAVQSMGLGCIIQHHHQLCLRESALSFITHIIATLANGRPDCCCFIRLSKQNTFSEERRCRMSLQKLPFRGAAANLKAATIWKHRCHCLDRAVPPGSCKLGNACHKCFYNANPQFLCWELWIYISI